MHYRYYYKSPNKSMLWAFVRGVCLLCWHWWNCWPSLLKLSLYNMI